MSKQSSYPVKDFKAQQAEWSWFLYEYCARWKEFYQTITWYNPYTHKVETYRARKEPTVGHCDRLYKLARTFYKLPVSYQQFYNWFFHNKWFYGEEDYRNKQRYYYSRKGNRRCYNPVYIYRNKRSYVRRAHHKPKEISEKEMANREWRSKKKDREYRKRNKGYGYGAKRAAHSIAEPKIRARNRMLLVHGRYDEMSDKYDRCIWQQIYWMML